MQLQLHPSEPVVEPQDEDDDNSDDLTDGDDTLLSDGE